MIPKEILELMYEAEALQAEVTKLRIENEMLIKNNQFLQETISRLSSRPAYTQPLPSPTAPWPINPAPYGPRCSKCGIDTSYPHACTRGECPSGFGNPWDNSTKVVD